MMNVVARCGILALVAAVAGSGNAQTPRGADTLSPKAISDSQAVLAQLASRIKSNGRDTAAWYRTGMVAWALYERAKAPNPPKTLDPTRLGRMADSSLRIAAEFAPDDVIYQLTIGDFLIASGVPSARTAAGKYYEAAVTAARKSKNNELHARAALEFGRVQWRRYDALANRRMSTNIGDIGRSLSAAMQPIAKGAAALEDLAARDREAETLQLLAKASGKGAMFVAEASPATMRAAMASAGMTAGAIGSAEAAGAARNELLKNPGISLGSVRNMIENTTYPLPAKVSGEGDFFRADTLFREAYEADPTSPATFRAVAMWLIEKKDWPELEKLARAHIERNRPQGYGWLALGLALHRQGRSLEASQVFDTSMMAFGPEDLRRLDSPARTLPPSRKQAIDDVWSKNRLAVGQILWQSSDPMWSDGLPERRVEFRARVAHAELRWTVEEAGIKGANTDRGDVFIRYGPADLVAVFGPAMMDYAQDIMTFWIYDSGLMFAFTSYAGFGTAKIPPDDRAMVDAHIESQPARWDNLGDMRPDSMVVTTARFRGTGDSLDVYVAALPPTDAIRESAPAHDVRGDVWLMAANGYMAFHNATVLETPGVHAWAARVPAGSYVYRVEASGRNSKRFARASGQVSQNDWTNKGAAISDIVIAAGGSDTPKPGARWRDLVTEPSLGRINKGAQVALVWENYEFGARSGSTQYDVSVSIIPQTTSSKFVAAIKGALSSIAKVEARADRTVIQYERTAPAATAIAEIMSLDLGETPAGSYTITVDVTDKATGGKFTRSATLVIR